MIEIVQDCEYRLVEKQLIRILEEAERFDSDKDSWISMEELKELVGV